MLGKDKRRQNIVIAAVILAAVVFCLILSRDGAYELAEDAVDGRFEMSADEVSKNMEELKEQALETSVQIQINAVPEVDKPGKRCNLMLGNPAENDKDFRVTVTLDESQKIIYQSQILKPGERLAYVTLDFVPEPGEYKGTAEFAVLDPGTGEAVGAVDAGLLLTVR